MLRTSVGRKFVMAVTGLILFGFVLGHMLGNLQIFLGPDELNRYAAFLKGLGELLWGARIVLLGSLVLHVVAAISLTLENRAARNVPYVKESTVQASYASRTMIWSGLILLAFIIFHLLHFTTGNILHNYYHFTDAKGRHDVYRMVVLGFRDPLVSLSYIVAMTLLALHIDHGFSSLFQSLGASNDKTRALLDKLSSLIALIIFIGNTSIPVACFLHLIGGGL